MLRNLRKFRALSWRERRLLIGVALLLPWIRLALRVCGLRWTQRRLDRFVPRRPVADGLSPPAINRIVRGASRLGSPQATCLRRSLVLWWLLKRRGVASEIRIGAYNRDGFKAHAWVEWQDGGQSDSPEALKHLVIFERWAQT